MICSSCRYGKHGNCRGGSWCDCQHRPQLPQLEETQDMRTEVAKLEEMLDGPPTKGINDE